MWRAKVIASHIAVAVLAVYTTAVYKNRQMVGIAEELEQCSELYGLLAAEHQSLLDATDHMREFVG